MCLNEDILFIQHKTYRPKLYTDSPALMEVTCFVLKYYNHCSMGQANMENESREVQIYCICHLHEISLYHDAPQITYLF